MRRRLRQLALASGTVQPRTEHAQLTLYPLPTLGAFPGEAGPLPTLQEWGSTVVATTHLACALSLSRCLTPSDCAHMARTCLFVIWTSATCTAYHASPVSPVSLGIVLSPHMQVVFALFWCLLGQVLPLVSDRMTPCPINPSLSVLGSDQASLCLARAFLSPWGGGGTTSSPAIKKKKEMRMLVHCPIYFAFSITMLWGVHQGDCSFFLQSTTLLVDAFVVCSTQKKNHTREMHLLRRFTVGNGRTRFYFLAVLYLLFKMDWGLRWGFLVGFCVALYFSVSRNSVFHACTVILRLVHDFWLRKGLSLYKLWDFLPL